jgi:hypothetical protein
LRSSEGSDRVGRNLSADEEELTDLPKAPPTDSSDAKPADSSQDNRKDPPVASSSTLDTKEQWNARSANLEVKRRERQIKAETVSSEVELTDLPKDPPTDLPNATPVDSSHENAKAPLMAGAYAVAGIGRRGSLEDLNDSKNSFGAWTSKSFVGAWNTPSETMSKKKKKAQHLGISS